MTTKETLIAKLYKGTCSRAELEILLNLIQQDTEEDDTEVLEIFWRQLKSYSEIEEPMASELVQRTLAKIEGKESVRSLQKLDKKNEQRKGLRRRRFTQIAAAATVLLLAGAFSWYWFRAETEQMFIIQTAFAEQKTITLPDQSIVTLNANSSLSFYKNWTTRDVRQVWLAGEAYFEVKKNETTGQKFQVITRDLRVEVLGTVFNVNAREGATKVYLEEGKVNIDLENQEDDIVMDPGDLVTYSRSSGEPLKEKRIEKEAPTSWKDGTVEMEDALLKDIIKEIHKVYDVTVEVENKAHLERKFTISIPVDDPELGYELMTELIERNDLKIERTGKLWAIK